MSATRRYRAQVATTVGGMFVAALVFVLASKFLTSITAAVVSDPEQDGEQR